MALNIPLFLVGMKILGKRQSVYTGLGIASLTLFLWLFEALIDRGYVVPFHTEQDYILAALYAGVTLGAGLGIVFRFGGTTGGSDIIARIINRKFGFSMGQIILSLDILIIGLSYSLSRSNGYCIPSSPYSSLPRSSISFRKALMPPKPSPLSAIRRPNLPIAYQPRWIVGLR